MHIFTAWLTSTSTTNERIPASVYPYSLENAIMSLGLWGGGGELDFTVLKAGTNTFACDCNADHLKRDVGGRHRAAIH